MLQDEYSRWFAHDPHVRAYQVLFESRAQLMSALLYGDAQSHLQQRCLACHTNPYAAAEKTHPERFFGVGCESCHGEASLWAAKHSTHAWRELKAEEKSATGFISMRDGAAVAKRCAGCHVGDPPGQDGKPVRNIDHDLLAAGHPRLNFEFTAYLANLPPHWNTHFSAKTRSDEAELWARGQLASAEAASWLLLHRAVDQAAPWPEFAEYDCFACHHNLHGKSWRQDAKHYGKRKPGALAWGTWYFALLPELLGSPLEDKLQACRQAMEQPLPNRPAVQLRLQMQVKDLAAAQATLKFDKAKLAAFLKKRLTDGNNPLPLTWDTAEQMFLAAQVLGPPWNDGALLETRAFPPGADGPTSFQPLDFYDLMRKRMK